MTLICYMCKYPINLFLNLDLCLLGLLTIGLLTIGLLTMGLLSDRAFDLDP